MELQFRFVGRLMLFNKVEVEFHFVGTRTGFWAKNGNSEVLKREMLKDR